jgi:hypothetical protein
MIKVSFTRILKSLLIAVAFAAVLSLGQGVARADEVFLAGFTNGCFGPDVPLEHAPPPVDWFIQTPRSAVRRRTGFADSAVMRIQDPTLIIWGH